MNKKLYLFCAAFFFIAALVLLLFRKDLFLVRFSPQHTVDPLTLHESYESNETDAIFNNKPLTIPPDLHRVLARKPITTPDVLGQTSGEKRIEVDLTNQRVYAFEGDQLVYNFLVSTGLWGRTPTGVFEIWTKIRSTKMSGGSKELGTYYYLPNVPFVMFFHNAEVPKWRGYSLHGTYWHNNFGHPMSHGCVNMKTEEVEQIYYWAKPDLLGKSSINSSQDNPGTKIIIYGVAPSS